jgi:predicted SnoaL-like aldol condensation-catalyzing enzyme
MEARMKSDHASKDRAVAFLEMVVAGKVREAYAEHVGPGFKHHNPYFRGDGESLLAGMAQDAEQFPHKEFAVQRALQDGDLVAVHSRLRHSPDERDMAVVHIFRFEDGRIAEFWDIAQVAPEDVANEHGMF